MLKFLSLALLTSFIMVTSAQAQVTSADIAKFNSDYAAVYKKCDLKEIKKFVNGRFSDNYIAQYKTPVGEPKTMDKIAIMAGMQETIDYIDKFKMKPSHCNTSATVKDLKLKGNLATVQIAQNEVVTLNAPTGQNIPISVNTICNHMIQKTNDVLKITKSECVSSK